MKGSALRLFEERDFQREQHALLKTGSSSGRQSGKVCEAGDGQNALRFPGTCNACKEAQSKQRA